MKPDLIEHARNVISVEISALEALKNRIDAQFIAACELMLVCEGRVVVTGMGKSGHIGSKIAATLASTGTPAFFIHPGEAGHGDLGMITRKDVVLAISNSGSTDEILTILPVIKHLGVGLITYTGNPESPLAKAATVHIDISVEREACPLNLAPTSSTTACLAMGDAMAVTLLEMRGFTEQDFAISHPSGRLGKRLLTRVADIMHAGPDAPFVRSGVMLTEAIVEMNHKVLGMTAVLDEQHRVLGILTDGDLRRAIKNRVDFHDTTVDDVMTPGCKTVTPDMLAVDAFKMLEGKRITDLLVVDADNRLVGALNMHDILQAGVV